MKSQNVFILATLFFISCKSSKIHEKDNSEFRPIRGLGKFQLSDSVGFIGRDTLLKSYYPDSTLKSIGKYAISRDSLISGLKIGEHREYYPNGNLKSQGSYQIDWYHQCCPSGPCAHYYNYKTGYWVYQYENGRIKMTGTFIVKDKFINTNCKGGDMTTYSETNMEQINAFDTTGTPIKPDKSMQLEFEKLYSSIDKDHKIAWHLDPKNRNVIKISMEK